MKKKVTLTLSPLQTSLFLFTKVNRPRPAFKNILCRFLVYALHEPKPSCGNSLNKLQVLRLLKEYTLYVYFFKAVFPQKT